MTRNRFETLQEKNIYDVYVHACVGLYCTDAMLDSPRDSRLLQYEEVLISLRPTRKEICYSDQTRNLFNILPPTLNTLLSR
jgi:hypothetical protein